MLSSIAESSKFMPVSLDVKALREQKADSIVSLSMSVMLETISSRLMHLKNKCLTSMVAISSGRLNSLGVLEPDG